MENELKIKVQNYNFSINDYSSSKIHYVSYSTIRKNTTDTNNQNTVLKYVILVVLNFLKN